MADKKVIVGIDLQAAQAIKSAAQLEAQISKLATETTGLRKNLKTLQNQEAINVAARENQIATVESLIRKYGENSQEVQRARAELVRLDLILEQNRADIQNTADAINRNKEATKQARAEQREFNKVAATTPDTLARQRLQLSQLKNEYKNFRVGVDGTEQDLLDLQKKILNLNNTISKQEQAIGVFSRNVGNYTNSIKNAFSGAFQVLTGGLLAGGIAGVASSIRGLADETIALYDVQAKADAQLRASLESTQGVAGRTFEQLKQQAQDLQDVTLFGDEQTQQLQALLLTFTNVREEVFDQSVPLIQDYAQALANASGGTADLRSATLQVGKALNDPIKGLGALSRAGVQFTEDQKALVQQLVETGETAQAQAIILRELETQFGGSARAAAEAGAGGIQQLQNRISDVKEEIGQGLLPIQEDLTRAQLRFFETLAGGVKYVVQFFMVLKEIPKFLRDNREELIGLTVALVALNFQTIAAQANTLRLAAAQRIAAIATRAQAVAQGLLNIALTANPIGVVVAALGLLAAAFAFAWKRSEQFRAVVVGVWESVKNIVTTYITGIKEQLLGVADLFIGIFTLDIGKIKASLKRVAEGVKQATYGVGVAAADGFRQGYNEQRDKDSRLTPEEEKSRLERAKKGMQIAYGDLGTTAGDAFTQGVKNSLSVAGLEEQIKDLKEAFDVATTDADRKRIAAEIKALEAQVKRLKAPLETPKAADPKKQLEEEEKLKRERLKTEREIVEKQIKLTEDGTEINKILRRKALRLEKKETLSNKALTEEQKQLIEAEFIARGAELEASFVIADQEKALQQTKDTLEKQELALRESYARRLISEEEFNEQRAELELLRLETEAATLAEGSLERLRVEAEIAEKEAEIQENKNARIKKSLDELTEEQKKAAEERRRIREAEVETADILISSARIVTEAIIEQTDERSAAAKAGFVITRALALAEVAINLQRELQNINTKASELATSLPGPVGLILSTAYRIGAIASAIAQGSRIVSQIRSVLFEEGGPVSDALTRLGGLASGPSHSEGGIPGVVQGVPVEFEGGEFIVRKEATQRNADVIEQVNSDAGRSRFGLVKLYKDGGPVMPAVKFAAGGLTQPVAAALQQEAISSASLTDAVRTALESMPSPVVSVVEIAETANRVSVKESRATL